MNKWAVWTAAVLLLLGLIGVGFWRQDRQTSLDRRLILAIRHRQAFEVERLLSAGADPNTVFGPQDRQNVWEHLRGLVNGNSQQSPRFWAPVLMYAVSRHDPSMVRSLLAHGADVNKADFEGRPCVLRDAVMRNPPAMLPLLLPHANQASKNDALNAACAGGHMDTAQTLLRSGADPNARDRVGMTPLLWAAEISPDPGRARFVRTLLTAGADPHQTYLDPDAGRSYTPRDLAARPRPGFPHGDRAVARLLDGAMKTP